MEHEFTRDELDALFHIVNNSFGNSDHAARRAYMEATGKSEAEFYKVRSQVLSWLINL